MPLRSKPWRNYSDTPPRLSFRRVTSRCRWPVALARANRSRTFCSRGARKPRNRSRRNPKRLLPRRRMGRKPSRREKVSGSPIRDSASRRGVPGRTEAVPKPSRNPLHRTLEAPRHLRRQGEVIRAADPAGKTSMAPRKPASRARSISEMTVGTAS